MTNSNPLLTEEMLANYFDLNKKKKEIETEMNHLKKQFHTYFDNHVGSNTKGEITYGGYKLQRQIRKSEKFKEEITINRLEELKMDDLIKVIKKPDDAKITSAINLGLLGEEDFKDCRATNFSAVISVKEVT